MKDLIEQLSRGNARVRCVNAPPEAPEGRLRGFYLYKRDWVAVVDWDGYGECGIAPNCLVPVLDS
jgi:hypothetical protein